ncbi:MAG: Holliday junction branch migration protein RuvA [Sumerlaeia bacterium]
MINHLNGILISCDDDCAVIDVNGLGFRCEIPGSTAAALPKKGERASLYTYLVFNPNDNEFTLFGFASETERECFEVLKSINRVGPRTALNILSQIEITAFAQAVVQQNVDYVAKVKGIGKKTAERLVMELREKMVPFISKDAKIVVLTQGKDNITDAVQGLMALGCKPAVAEKAIAAAIEQLGEEAKTEDLIREGLRWR